MDSKKSYWIIYFGQNIFTSAILVVRLHAHLLGYKYNPETGLLILIANLGIIG